MEGKTVILCVFIMNLIVMSQIQVEASKVCCPSPAARKLYNACEFMGDPMLNCVAFSGCKKISGTICPPGFVNDVLENSGDGVSEYCKLGCVSSVCSAFKTLPNSDASEIVNGGVVDQCVNACSSLCIKGSVTAVETA